jgi:hypothetical protein
MKGLGKVISGIVPQHGAPVARRDVAPAMAHGDALRILAAPLSPLAEGALAAMNGALVRVERQDPRWPNASPLVSYRQAEMPKGVDKALPEVERRIEAMRALLAPADHAVVAPWVMQLGARTHFRSRGAEAQAEIAMTTQALCEPGAGVPAACFTEETLWTVIDAATKGGQRWFPPASAIRDALLSLVRPPREELAGLEKLAKILRGRVQSNLLAAPKPGVGEVFTDAEVDAWIASVAATPPSLPRMVRCRAFLKTLAQRRPDLSPDRIARIEALRDEEYGADPSAELLPADHPERVAADEALRRRRQAQIDALLPRPQQAQGNAPA